MKAPGDCERNLDYNAANITNKFQLILKIT